MLKVIHLECCIHDPGHLVDVNEIKNVWVVLLHTEYDKVHQLQLHILQACILAVEDPGYLLVLLLPLQPLQVVDQNPLDIFQAISSLDVSTHSQNYELTAVLKKELIMKIPF